MPERPTFRAGDPGCQQTIDEKQREYEVGLATLLSTVCDQCGTKILTPLSWLSAQPGDVVQAPSRCAACRQGE